MQARARQHTRQYKIDNSTATRGSQLAPGFELDRPGRSAESARARARATGHFIRIDILIPQSRSQVIPCSCLSTRRVADGNSDHVVSPRHGHRAVHTGIWLALPLAKSRTRAGPRRSPDTSTRALTESKIRWWGLCVNPE